MADGTGMLPQEIISDFGPHWRVAASRKLAFERPRQREKRLGYVQYFAHFL